MAISASMVKSEASETGQAATGHGKRAGLGSAPSPGLHNLEVCGGDTTLADLIKGIDYGLYVHQVIGQGQGNTLSGAFSNPIGMAYLIENGEVKGRVRGVSIAGNVYEVLKGGVDFSSDRLRVYGVYELPSVQVRAMNVVGG